MTKFQVGKTYYTRSTCNHDCLFSYTVVKRTPKFITILKDSGETKRRKVEIWNNAETIYPEGRYSMCPILSANRMQ